MLDPREGRGEVVLGLTEAGEGVVVPGETAGGFRCGREDEVEDEREGGSEFKSGGMMIDYDEENETVRSMKLRGIEALEEARRIPSGSGHDHRDESAYRGEGDHMTRHVRQSD